MKWVCIKDRMPEVGVEVLLYNKEWIDDDFNPKGVRLGFYSADYWISAYWCNYHDDYHTRDSDDDNHQFTDYRAENQIPTHWIEIPKFE